MTEAVGDAHLEIWHSILADAPGRVWVGRNRRGRTGRGWRAPRPARPNRQLSAEKPARLFGPQPRDISRPFSGGHVGLGRRIAGREFERLTITQDWLEEAITGDPEFPDRQEEFEAISTQLDRSLARFSETARQASKATASYGVELSLHADGLAGGTADGLCAVNLLHLTRAMAERSRLHEADISRSEEEVASLRKHLARARRDADLDHFTGPPNRRAF